MNITSVSTLSDEGNRRRVAKGMMFARYSYNHWSAIELRKEDAAMEKNGKS